MEWQITRECLEWKESEDFSWKHPHWPLENIYISTTCRRLKMSGRLSHLYRKINFAISTTKSEFVVESESGRSANGKGTWVLIMACTIYMILGARRSYIIAATMKKLLRPSMNTSSLTEACIFAKLKNFILAKKMHKLYSVKPGKRHDQQMKEYFNVMMACIVSSMLYLE